MLDTVGRADQNNCAHRIGYPQCTKGSYHYLMYIVTCSCVSVFICQTDQPSKQTTTDTATSVYLHLSLQSPTAAPTRHVRKTFQPQACPVICFLILHYGPQTQPSCTHAMRENVKNIKGELKIQQTVFYRQTVRQHQSQASSTMKQVTKSNKPDFLSRFRFAAQ